jgi:hypothetical protein
MDSYEIITKYFVKFSELLNFLIPNRTKFDIDQKEKNIEIGKYLSNELKDFNMFKILENYYFSYGLEDTIKMVSVLKIRFSYKLLCYKKDYNLKTFKKAKEGTILYRTDELRNLIHFSDNLILGTISEFRNFESHYLSKKNN